MSDRAAGQTSLDPSVLGKILLLQSTLHAAPDQRRLAQQACHALGGLGSIAKIAVCINSDVCEAQGFAGVGGDELFSYFKQIQSGGIGEEGIAGIDSVDFLAFQVGSQIYGGFLIVAADELEYQLYRPYISNTANLIALMVENVVQGKQLKDLNQTLEKRVEERTGDLQAERDKAQNYLDIAGVLLMVIGSDQKVTMINRKGCEILGYSEQEIVGCNWIEKFIPEHDQDTVKALFNQSMAGEIVPEDKYENPIVAKDGQLKLVSWNNNLLKD